MAPHHLSGFFAARNGVGRRTMNHELRIRQVEIHTLEAPLAAPFTCASSDLGRVRNLALRVALEGGASGWGEIALLPPITVEDEAGARAALEEEAGRLLGGNAGEWRRIAAGLLERRAAFGSVRAGIETAVLDALTRSLGVALFHFFGGCEDTLVTDMTIPICPAEAAGMLAARYREDGFDTLKVKIGRDVGEDFTRVLAIRRGHPHCRLILDANAAYSVAQVFELLGELRAAGIEPALFEQPVAREDWEGLGRLAREAGVPVAADESCRTPEDAVRIGRGGLAQVLNIKLAKSGVVQALDIAAIARAFGLGLMIGGMVETRLGMGFSAHLAAGLGGFDWVDLDTPLLLTEDPITGGYRREGARYRLDGGTPGHGAALRAWGSP
ncbi:MAG: dipeptide epimerase [Gammaproteobacteria bacterium]